MPARQTRVPTETTSEEMRTNQCLLLDPSTDGLDLYRISFDYESANE